MRALLAAAILAFPALPAPAGDFSFRAERARAEKNPDFRFDYCNKALERWREPDGVTNKAVLDYSTAVGLLPFPLGKIMAKIAKCKEALAHYTRMAVCSEIWD
ncbi:MAG: hypothetical protein HY922_03805 [Elusimicrobia bacterium]|nr:hypothetical protein [Elusimicrobiota bacterium]